MAFNKLIQGKNLPKAVKGLNPSEHSILRASSSLFGGIPRKKNKDWQREGTQKVHRIHENNKESDKRIRKKRFISWKGSIMRGLQIKRKLKAKNVKVCTVFLAYTLSNKCKILRIRLK